MTSSVPTKTTMVIVTFVLCSVILSAMAIAKTYPLAEKVNPFIGTSAHGHSYPGASMPFGMVQLSPDTYNEGWDWCSGYHYSDNSIMGFSHTHLDGTGCADYGDFLFMPTTGSLKFKAGSRRNPEQGYRSRFSHGREKAMAGFYGVYLQDYDIDVQLTTTRRVGFHKYTFPATKEANVIIDLAHYIGAPRYGRARRRSSGIVRFGDMSARAGGLQTGFCILPHGFQGRLKRAGSSSTARSRTL